MTHNLPARRPFAGGLLAVGLLTLVGCGGGPPLAPVSGVVKLDGKPYANAVISFQPIGTKDAPNPGRGSSGSTDESGRFVLRYDGLQDGAVVGKHRIRIVSKGDFMPQSGDGTGSDDYVPPANIKVDPIPPEWGGLSEKTFDVPPGGTDKADFDIESVKPKAKKGKGEKK